MAICNKDSVKVYQISFIGMRGVADKEWVPQSVKDGRTDIPTTLYPPAFQLEGGGVKKYLIFKTCSCLFRDRV